MKCKYYWLGHRGYNRVYRGSTGIMDRKMEATIFRLLGLLGGSLDLVRPLSNLDQKA